MAPRLQIRLSSDFMCYTASMLWCVMSVNSLLSLVCSYQAADIIQTSHPDRSTKAADDPQTASGPPASPQTLQVRWRYTVHQQFVNITTETVINLISFQLICWLSRFPVIGPQVVWAAPPGEDRSPRQLWPASQHGALLLPGAVNQRCGLLQSQQPELCGLTAPQALPLRTLRCGDASWEGLRLWPLHCLLLQHRRRWVQRPMFLFTLTVHIVCSD